MADDDLSDLSDMSRLTGQPASTPTPRPVDRERPPPPPGTPPGASAWERDERARAAAPRPSGCGPGAVAGFVLVLLIGLLGGVVALRAGTSDDLGSGGEVVVETTGRTGEQIDPPGTTAPTDLYQGGLAAAYDDLLGAAGDPAEILELIVYDAYAILAYRDPAAPANIDRRIWRDGQVGDADANPIDDRADEDTMPALFSPAELDPAVVGQAIADAPNRYDVPVEVTHVIVDRFLPFDDRVLIRVYAKPADGRSGGGYVTYDTAGTYVDTCC